MKSTYVGKYCWLTKNKCNYAAVMPSMINDMGLKNLTIQPMANYGCKNKLWREQVSEAREEIVSKCIFIYCVWVNRERAPVTQLVLVHCQRAAPSPPNSSVVTGKMCFLTLLTFRQETPRRAHIYIIRRKKKLGALYLL